MKKADFADRFARSELKKLRIETGIIPLCLDFNIANKREYSLCLFAIIETHRLNDIT